MQSFNSKLIEKAKEAKSVDELLAMAKASGVEISSEGANNYFAQLNPQMGELSDAELDNISGGGCGEDNSQVNFEGELYPGRLVYLCNSGHTFGSVFCKNAACRGAGFSIIRQIDTDMYLIGCKKCDQTYHAVRDNIV